MSGEASVRAGLWPRAIALLIDGCCITLVLGLLGLVLFTPTGGKIRVQHMLLGSQSCTAENPQVFQELDIALPSDFRVTQIARCTNSLLGHVHDSVLVAAEVTRSGATTIIRELTYPLDTAGHPTRPFYLDSMWVLIFAIYVIALEWRTGRTLGKDLMDVRVQSQSGASPGFAPVVKRFLVRFIGLVVLQCLSLIATSPTVSLAILFAGLLAFVAVSIDFVLAVRRGDLPWHDRFAGSEVVIGR